MARIKKSDNFAAIARSSLDFARFPFTIHPACAEINKDVAKPCVEIRTLTILPSFNQRFTLSGSEKKSVAADNSFLSINSINSIFFLLESSSFILSLPRSRQACADRGPIVMNDVMQILRTAPKGRHGFLLDPIARRSISWRPT